MRFMSNEPNDAFLNKSNCFFLKYTKILRCRMFRYCANNQVRAYHICTTKTTAMTNPIVAL